jgi:Na+-driven multidrug efflux pump
VSHAVGAGDRRKQVGLVTWGIVLAFLVVLLFITAGFLSMKPLFTLLGADSETLPVIEAYMRIWYPGVLVMVVPMAGFAAIRGLGDTKTPSGIILVAMVLNNVFQYHVLLVGIRFVEWTYNATTIISCPISTPRLNPNLIGITLFFVDRSV